MSLKQEERGIFINGRQQIIEMLKVMGAEEKKKLLNNIQQRNSVVAKELSEESFSFEDLFKLNKTDLNKILSSTNPAIIALAIYPLSKELQKSALSCLEREIAEMAFNTMGKNLSGRDKEIKRAQEKITQIAINLSRQKQILI